MLCGVIDIGSNSIKAFVYDINGKDISTKGSHCLNSHLYAYIENGALSDEGINVLCESVAQCNQYLIEQACERIMCFATAALRDSVNSQNALSAVYKHCGIKAELISAQTEALCDMLSMRDFCNVSQGVGVDLGGGSGQIVVYDEKGLKQSVSLPIGALAVKTRFVSGDFPTKEEENAIAKFVSEQLSCLKPESCEALYVMGGSNVVIDKLVKLMLNKDTLHLSDISLVRDMLYALDDKKDFLSTHAQGREFTVLPAMSVLMTIAEFFCAKSLITLQSGVREGYLIKNIIFN